MNYKSFQYVLCEKVQQILGGITEVYLSDVPKNNGIQKRALMFRSQDMTISPTFYTEDMYQAFQAGESVEKLAEYIIGVFIRTKEECTMDLSFLDSFEIAKKDVFYRFVNYEQNEEMLKDIPHIPYLDLAIVCYHRMTHGVMQGATMMIRNSNLESWDINQGQLFVHAFANTPVCLPVTLTGMQEMLGNELDSEEEMYVLTNTDCCLGAACLLYPHMLKWIAEEIKGSFYVLPSSIHECIIVPANVQSDSTMLEEMVKEINVTHVRPEEILSDKVYYYDTKSGTLDLVE